MSAELREIELLFNDAEVTAGAFLKIRIPAFMIRYLRDDRDSARDDALRYARELLDKEFKRLLAAGKLMDGVHAEISFEDNVGKTTERLIGGSWIPV